MTDWQWQLFPWSNQWLDLIHELQKKKRKNVLICVSSFNKLEHSQIPDQQRN